MKTEKPLRMLLLGVLLLAVTEMIKAELRRYQI